MQETYTSFDFQSSPCIIFTCVVSRLKGFESKLGSTFAYWRNLSYSLQMLCLPVFEREARHVSNSSVLWNLEAKVCKSSATFANFVAKKKFFFLLTRRCCPGAVAQLSGASEKILVLKSFVASLGFLPALVCYTTVMDIIPSQVTSP